MDLVGEVVRNPLEAGSMNVGVAPITPTLAVGSSVSETKDQGCVVAEYKTINESLQALVTQLSDMASGMARVLVSKPFKLEKYSIRCLLKLSWQSLRTQDVQSVDRG